MDPQSAHEKQLLDPWNTHEKKIFGWRNKHEKKFCTNELPTRKNIGLVRPIIARNSHNLAHSLGPYW